MIIRKFVETSWLVGKRDEQTHEKCGIYFDPSTRTGRARKESIGSFMLAQKADNPECKLLSKIYLLRWLPFVGFYEKKRKEKTK